MLIDLSFRMYDLNQLPPTLDLKSLPSPMELPRSLDAQVLKALLSELKNESLEEADPKKALVHANRDFCSRVRSRASATCFYALLNLNMRELRVASAGDIPYRIWRADMKKLEYPDPLGGFAMGFDAGPKFGEALNVRLHHLYPRDRVIIFSSGLEEALNTDSQHGVDVLDRCAKSFSHLSSNDFTRSVKRDLAASKQYVLQVEDAALLTFRFL